MISKNKDDFIKLIVLDPGHFHAALLQMKMHKNISPIVHVYAPIDNGIYDYLKAVENFNTRPLNATNWQSKVFTGSDFVDRMVQEKAGNLVVLAGNNGKRIQYILKTAQAGLNILADKPLCINKEGFDLLKNAFRFAHQKGVLLYDIMTERSEITNILQKKLCNNKALFGELLKGSPDNPAVTMESVHHFSKTVNGEPVKRPPWYFDVKQTGEGITDVTTHLIDLTHWICFPEQAIDYHKNIQVVNAAHWPTKIGKQQFRQVTQEKTFPPYLSSNIKNDTLYVQANGYIIYRINGHYIKVKIEWPFEDKQGFGDRHYSMVKGTKATIIIETHKKQQLFVKPSKKENSKRLKSSFIKALSDLQQVYPGLGFEDIDGGWHIVIPDTYRHGHESHFSDVVERYVKYLKNGILPEWEKANMLSKYYITTTALNLIEK